MNFQNSERRLQRRFSLLLLRNEILAHGKTACSVPFYTADVRRRRRQEQALALELEALEPAALAEATNAFLVESTSQRRKHIASERPVCD